VRHRRLEAPNPAQTINGLIAHLSQFALRMSSDPFGSAEALLHLRCIALNGDWENFITWTYQQYQDQLRDRQAVQIRTDEPMLLPRAA
jgi:hypothetical protein